jgi:curved DNA-binding protein CbpA
MKYSKLLEDAKLFCKIASMTPEQARAIIGVSPNASESEINKAYRILARKYHPDINKSPEANLKSVELNIAKDILLNPERQGFAGDMMRQQENLRDDVEDILKREQEKADAWIEDIKTRREEYDMWASGKIKTKDLKHPDNIENAKRLQDREKEYKRKRKEELKQQKSKK